MLLFSLAKVTKLKLFFQRENDLLLQCYYYKNVYNQNEVGRLKKSQKVTDK